MLKCTKMMELEMYLFSPEEITHTCHKVENNKKYPAQAGLKIVLDFCIT